MTNILYQREIIFHDQAGIKFIIKAKLQGCQPPVEHMATFSLSGKSANSCGQLQDSIQPATASQTKLLNLWKEWHLKQVPFGSFLAEFTDLVIAIEKEEAEKDTSDKGLDLLMFEAGIHESDKEKCQAYLEATGATDLMDFNESYSGEFASDEDFAEDMATQIGAIDRKSTWPNNCIDWEMAAKELMYDYSEQDGYYFRNL